MRMRTAIAAFLFTCGLILPAAAQDYPNRLIKIVVGFPPGGGVDAVARLFAEKMSGLFGQPVVVVNQGGAAGGIAGKRVSGEEPRHGRGRSESSSHVIERAATMTQKEKRMPAV